MGHTVKLVIAAVALAALTVFGYFVIQTSLHTADLAARLNSLEEDGRLASIPPGFDTPTDSLADSSVITGRLNEHSDRLTELNNRLRQIASDLDSIRLSINDSAVDATLKQSGESGKDLGSERAQQIVQRHKQVLNEFYSEPVDSNWAVEKQSILQEAFSNINLQGAEMTFAECHSVRCEVRWRIDENLSNLERFELDNNIAIEAARVGLSSAVFVEQVNPGEFRAIFSPAAPINTQQK